MGQTGGYCSPVLVFGVLALRHSCQWHRDGISALLQDEVRVQLQTRMDGLEEMLEQMV
jgi:hypothetical protein